MIIGRVVSKMDIVNSKSNSPNNNIGYADKAHCCSNDWIYDLLNNMNKIVENESIMVGLLEADKN